MSVADLRRLLAGLAACAVLLGAAQAFAHATLVSAEPRDGAMLSAPPDALILTFNEPVAPLVFRLIGPGGTATTPAAEAHDSVITLRAANALAQGSYMLSWRVISADGHPVGGAIQFAVGAQSERPKGTSSGENESLAAAILAARFAIYVGLFIGIGGVAFAAWSGTRLPQAAEIVIAATLGVALAAVPLSIGFQGADALDLPLLSFWRPDVCAAGLRTSYGVTALIAAAACFAALLSLLATGLTRQITAIVALAGGAAALAASGHASNASPQLLMRPAVFLHAIAIALWVGSLLPLLTLFHGRGTARPALMRFSRSIPYVLAVLVATGVILAIVQVEYVAALWSTDYGRVLLAKLTLLAAVAGLAAYNRFTLTPRLMRRSRKARRRFVQTLGAEILCMLAVFALVALWRFTPPPRALAASESAFVHLHGEQTMADVTVTPGRAGPIELRVRLRREDFTAIEPKDVRVQLSSAGLEPLERPAQRMPDGEWRVRDVTLPLSGIWTVRVEALVTDFKREVLDGPIVIGR